MSGRAAMAAGLGLGLSLGLALAAGAAQAATWAKNDPRRPLPPAVTPHGAVLGLPPPSDAVVLFDGRSLDAWAAPPGAGWRIVNGDLVPGGTVFNNMMTKARFSDLQLHLEFREPSPPRGEGQHRGNSGVFLMGRFEIQIVDPVDNPTYADGTMAAVYGETPPRVIAARRPGEWQSLDIYFDAPRFRAGRLETPAFVTVVLNGIVVHDHQQIFGDTGAKATDPPSYLTPATDGPIGLQDHGAKTDLVAFRNIWVRPLGRPAP